MVFRGRGCSADYAKLRLNTLDSARLFLPYTTDAVLAPFVIMKVMGQSLAEIKARLAAEKPYLYEKYGVEEIGVFGSYVRGDYPGG